MKPLEGQSIAVLGLGASGSSAARLALRMGGAVYVSDRSTEPSAAAGADQLRALGARVELGGHDLERTAGADTVVVSPGIPPDAPVLQALRARGRRWVSEPEFAFRFLKGPLIAVTGTNGKTTTAALTAHLLREAKLEVGLGGNIGAAFGPPASDLALLDPVPDWFVVEVSSFQLADIDAFSPGIGVVTNLAPDHLDRYPSVDAYYADKACLFRNASSGSRWVLNASDRGVEDLAGDAPGARYRFGLDDGPGTHAFVRDGDLTLRVEDGGPEETLVPHEALSVLGQHNVENALAASLTARIAGADAASIAQGLPTFQALPHRMEPVGNRGGLRWVNDSKATNVAATSRALQSLSGPLVLLLGGKDKGEDLTPLGRSMHSGVRGVVVFGEVRERMAKALMGIVPLSVVPGTFEDAVRTGVEMAQAGDILLLSPACSSFDMFRNYEARGSRFAALARGEG